MDGVVVREQPITINNQGKWHLINIRYFILGQKTAQYSILLLVHFVRKDPECVLKTRLSLYRPRFERSPGQGIDSCTKDISLVDYP